MSSSGGSFIPKSPVGTVQKKRPVRRLYVLSYVVYSLFAGAVIVAIVTGIYHFTQVGTLDTRLEMLNQTRESFQASELERIAALDQRIRLATDLLDRYNSPLALLTALEAATVSSVQLQQLSYQKGADNTFTMTLVADNPSFNVALFQREQLNQTAALADATITDVTYLPSQPSVDGSEQSTPAQVIFTVEQSLPAGTLPFAVRQAAPIQVPGSSLSATSSADGLPTATSTVTTNRPNE